jgi:hypothetical protein
VPGRWRIEGDAPGTTGEIFVNLLDESVSSAAALPDPPPPAGPVRLTPRPFRAEASGPLLAVAILLLLAEQFVAPPVRAGRLP